MNLNIRGKIILICAAILFLGIGANTLVNSIIFTRDYSNLLQSKAFVIGQTLKTQLDRLLSLHIPLDGLVGFDEQCRELVNKYDDISYAMIIDPTGKIIFHNDPSFHGQVLPDFNPARKTKGQKDDLKVRYIEGDDFYDILIPVLGTQDELIAWARIGFPISLISKKTRGMVVSSVVIASLFLCAGMALLIILLNVWVVKPLDALISVIQDVRLKGPNSTQLVEIDSKDEIGQLGSTFNYMIAELRESHRRIKNYTEELELEIEVRKRAQKAAEAASIAKSNFLATMSHELRTPLNHIIGFTDLLVDKKLGDLNEQQEEYLNDVLQSSNRLLFLVNDILNLSSIEAGKEEMKLQDINLKALFGNSLTMIREKAQKHRIKLVTDIDKAPETITGDERKLKQIVYNLLSNAVKFTPDGGIVTVSARTVEIKDKEMPPGLIDYGSAVEISITDTGIGIKEEDISRIFDPFEQADGSASRRYGGTGLGLSLAKSLVELHGGKIWAASEGEGKGSTFRFIIPLMGHIDNLQGTT